MLTYIWYPFQRAKEYILADLKMIGASAFRASSAISLIYAKKGETCAALNTAELQLGFNHVFSVIAPAVGTETVGYYL